MTAPLSRRRVLAASLVTLVILGAALVGSFPARQILTQRRETAAAEQELARIEDELARLRSRRELLANPTEIARLARDEYGYVPPGWESYHLVTPQLGDVSLPQGWPFLLNRG
jgi:cell division protein FtsB